MQRVSGQYGAAQEISHILVVDDEEDVRDLLSHYLSSQGYKVEVCGDGYSALRLLSEQEYDLVILDIMMPDMDGISTMHKIRQLNAKVKIVVITGNLEDKVFDQAVDESCGADGFLNKPFRMENLLTCLDVVLRKGGKYVSPL